MIVRKAAPKAVYNWDVLNSRCPVCNNDKHESLAGIECSCDGWTVAAQYRVKVR